MSLEPLADKWTAFGWTVKAANGHDFRELAAAIDFARGHKDGPVVVIAHTVKGKGVDFMENQPGWHYGGLDSELIARAKRSIGGE